jgi:hypothetical protein
MSAINQIEKEIREAVVFLRENNQTIPSATIQFMKDASIEKLNQGQTLPIDSVVGRSEQFTSKQLWKMAQKYNADDFIQMVKEIEG